jgi:outer membrane protein with beta-barrel domain
MFRINGLCKILLFVLLFSFFLKAANGQFTYGVKFGVSYSTTISYGYGNLIALGLVGGITSNIEIGKDFFISLQLYYSQKGYTTYEGSTIRINYLNLPVLCGYRMTNHLQVLLGFNLGILMKDKYEKADTSFITTGQLQRIDPGLDAGLRYQLGRFCIDFTFIRSLIGIQKTNQTVYNYNVLGNAFPQTETLPESDKSKNQNFEVSIFYLFGGK